MHPDDLEIIEKSWDNAINSQTAFQFEYRIKRASDDRYRWHLVKGEPLKDESGQVIGWFGTSTDIEDQMKQLEKKDEFIGVASHELKTPLTSLKGYVQLLNEINLPDPGNRSTPRPHPPGEPPARRGGATHSGSPLPWR